MFLAITIVVTVISTFIPSVLFIYWMCCVDNVYSRTLICAVPILNILGQIATMAIGMYANGATGIVLNIYYFYVFWVYRMQKVNHVQNAVTSAANVGMAMR